MSIFDEFNEKGIEALRPTNRIFTSLNFPETSGNAIDAIAFSGTESRFPGFPSRFEDSPFGVAWDAAIYRDDVLMDTTPVAVRYAVTVSDDKRKIKERFENEVVDDDVIVLYLVVQDKKPIKYNKPEKEDLRLANIRFSNIVEIVGFVMGDEVLKAVQDDSSLYQEYIDKYVRSFTETDEDIIPLRKELSSAFDDYLENPRSNFFKRSFIGNLIKTELKKELQEFWKPILSSLAREIRVLKIEDEKYWQPYTASGDLKEDSKYTPIFPVAEGAQEVELILNGIFKQFELFDAIIADYLNVGTLKGKPDVVLFKDEKNNNILIKIFREVYEFFKGIVSFVKEGLENFIKNFTDSAFTLNAFFVGVYNGVINFIASLVDLLSFFAGFLSGDSEQVFEKIGKEFEKLKKDGFFSYIYDQLAKFFEKVSKRYDSTQAKYVISKNLGEDLFKIFEVLIAIYSGVQIAKSTATTIKGLRKQVDDLFETKNKKIDDLENDLIKEIFGDGIFRGKILSEIEIEDWAKLLKKRYGTKIKKVKSFGSNSKNSLAQFDPNSNTILYKENVTNYLMFHESMHAQEMSVLGFKKYVKDAPLKGTRFPDDYSDENMLRSYRREKYVHDRIIENSKKQGFNSDELFHNFMNLDLYTYHLERRGIQIPD